MEGAEKILEELAARAQLEGTDFYGSDGLLYCGKCKTRRERRIAFPIQAHGEERIVPVVCKCRAEAMEREKAEEEHKEQMRQLDRMRKNSLIESRFRSASLATFCQTAGNAKLYKVASKYVENFQRMYEQNQGIMFWGPIGTGKSFTAACIANELLGRMTTVVMTSFVKILEDTGFKTDESEYLAGLNQPKLLIIDDLGAERSTDYALEKVYNVIDSRYRAGKPLILTTNLTLREMQGETDIRYRRIYDRIFEMCYPFHVGGSSLREEEAARRYDEMHKLMEE